MPVKSQIRASSKHPNYLHPTQSVHRNPQIFNKNKMYIWEMSTELFQELSHVHWSTRHSTTDYVCTCQPNTHNQYCMTNTQEWENSMAIVILLMLGIRQNPLWFTRQNPITMEITHILFILPFIMINYGLQNNPPACHQPTSLWYWNILF